MNPIPEPTELLEAECNALGLYGLPQGALAELGGVKPRNDPPTSDADRAAGSAARAPAAAEADPLAGLAD